MLKRNFITVIACMMLLISCASSRISSHTPPVKLSHQINAIAIAPGGGLLADAIGVELSNRGFTVIDPTSTSSLLVRLNLTEIEVARPEGISKLKAYGVDAYLIVRTAAGRDNRPESASARMNSTQTGQVVAGVTWQNGWGGVEGSPADRVMRKNLTEAANEIADALAQRVR